MQDIENPEKPKLPEKTIDEKADILLKLVSFQNNIDSSVKILLDILKGNKVVSEKDKNAQTTEFMHIFETTSHAALIWSFIDEYRMLSYDLTEKLIKEYSCVSHSERMLVEIIVNAFIRTLDNSRRLNNMLEIREITPNKSVYIATLSKQLDRANRQYLQALLTLKQLKSPTIDFKISATKAFLSNNQQVNIQDHEIIKPI